MFPQKAKLISLLIAAVVTGVIVLVNVDRQIPVWGDKFTPVSEHGWPLVYLLRHGDEELFAENANNQVPFRWPWPVDENEVRTFSSSNLTTDIIVGTAIVLIVYMMAHTVLREFITSTASASKPDD